MTNIEIEELADKIANLTQKEQALLMDCLANNWTKTETSTATVLCYMHNNSPFKWENVDLKSTLKGL